MIFTTINNSACVHPLLKILKTISLSKPYLFKHPTSESVGTVRAARKRHRSLIYISILPTTIPRARSRLREIIAFHDDLLKLYVTIN